MIRLSIAVLVISFVGIKLLAATFYLTGAIPLARISKTLPQAVVQRPMPS